MKFPEGQIMTYIDEYENRHMCSDVPASDVRRSNLQRTTGEEYRAKDRMIDEQIQELREAAEAHRQV